MNNSNVCDTCEDCVVERMEQAEAENKRLRDERDYYLEDGNRERAALKARIEDLEMRLDHEQQAHADTREIAADAGGSRPQRIEGEPPEGSGMLAQVKVVRHRDTAKETRFTETYVAEIKGGDLVDREYGDTIGWAGKCMDRYILIDALLEFLEGEK